jgi:sugar phosphate isomerase/epimerase
MPCVEVAEQVKVKLLIEPEPELFIETFGQYLQFIRRINSPWIGLNFDIGHAYCVGEDPQNWIDKMCPHTVHYHFEDIAATRVHKHLIPGHGAIDFAATLLQIKNTNYSGWITVELYPYIDNPDNAAREAKKYLTDLMNRLGIPLEQ